MASKQTTRNAARRGAQKGASKPAVPKSMVGTAQRMTPMSTGVRGTDFKGRERLASVNATASGVIGQYNWNPGLEDTFTLGHQIARSFEKYLVNNGGNSVTYVTSSSTLKEGRIYMYANYDPSDQLPTTEDEFADRSDVVSACLWENLTLHLRGHEMTPGGPKPIRVGETAQDLNITDGCTIVIGTFGASVDGLAGNVFINYNARLLVQRPIPTQVTQPKRSAIFGFNTSFQISNDTDLGVWERIADGLGTTRASAAGAEDFDGVLLKPGAYIISAQVGLDFSAHTGATFTRIRLSQNGITLPATEGAENFANTQATSLLLHTNHNYIVVPSGGAVYNVVLDFANASADPFVSAVRTKLLITAA